jgi:predicted LPLAT superfamily acyltransferase
MARHEYLGEECMEECSVCGEECDPCNILLVGGANVCRGCLREGRNLGDVEPYAAVDESVYKGVRVLWDEDYDHRVLSVVDSISPEIRKSLVAIHERKALIQLWWKDTIPEKYAAMSGIDVFDGDYWSLENAVVC